jgi:hypothetical protein
MFGIIVESLDCYLNGSVVDGDEMDRWKLMVIGVGNSINA